MGDTEKDSFTRSLGEFIAVDDRIKVLNKQAKELRENKHVLEESISSHMLDNELQKETFEASTVTVVKKKRTPNVFKKANVEQCALTMFGAEKAGSLLEMIEGLKETTETHRVKRLRTA